MGGAVAHHEPEPLESIGDTATTRSGAWIGQIGWNVFWDNNPRLRAAGPDMGVRLDPGSVVERSAAHDASFDAGQAVQFGIAADPDAAVGTGPPISDTAATEGPRDKPRRPGDGERICSNYNGKPKCRPRQGLTIRAMTDRCAKRRLRDGVAQGSTMAAARLEETALAHGGSPAFVAGL